MDQLEGN